MSHKTLRVISILGLLGLAVVVPVISSGYSELRKASGSSSYTEIASHYWNAARRLPWRADLYELAGHEYYYAKEYALADAAYQWAFQRNALTAEGWVAWGDVNYLKNDPARGTEIWEQGLAQPGPSDKLYSRLAQIYQEKKDYERAVEYLRHYVSNHLEDAPAHYRLGLLLTLSDPQAAISELITASGLNPEFDPAAQTLRSALNLASLSDSPSERLVITGRGLGLVSEWELALAAFQKAAKADEGNAEAWAWLAEANQQTSGALTGEAMSEGEGQTLEQDRVREYLDRALSLNPGSAVVHTLRGLYFQRTGNNREALIEFQAAVTLQPDDPALYVSIGESYSKLGDLIRALEAYQYAANLVPEQAHYWRLLAQFCGQNNVNLENVGIPAAQRAVVITGETSESLDLLGWLLTLDARYREAERRLLRALELDAQNTSAHFHLAMLYLQTDQRSLAQEYLIRARDLGNTDAQALLDQYFP
jgi:tetratricopeptide (TPR) repeat protein